MADIELVIKIPESQYKTLNAKSQVDVVDVIDDKTLIDAIRKGTPLPKGHGRLTDLDEIINFTYNTYGVNSGKCITKDNIDFIDYIYNKAETIIDADKEEEDLDNLDSMLKDLWNATVEDHRKHSEV